MTSPDPAAAAGDSIKSLAQDGLSNLEIEGVLLSVRSGN